MLRKVKRQRKWITNLSKRGLRHKGAKFLNNAKSEQPRTTVFESKGAALEIQGHDGK